MSIMCQIILFYDCVMSITTWFIQLHICVLCNKMYVNVFIQTRQLKLKTNFSVLDWHDALHAIYSIPLVRN